MGQGIRGKDPALSVGIGNKFRQTCVTAKNVRSREKNLKLGWCWRCGGLGLCRWMSPGETCSGPWTPGSGLPPIGSKSDPGPRAFARRAGEPHQPIRKPLDLRVGVLRNPDRIAHDSGIPREIKGVFETAMQIRPGFSLTFGFRAVRLWFDPGPLAAAERRLNRDHARSGDATAARRGFSRRLRQRWNQPIRGRKRPRAGSNC